MSARLVAMRCRTSDRTPAAGRGVDELAALVGERLGLEPRTIGTPEEPRAAGYEADLSDSRGCLLEAGGQVDDALAAGDVPLLVASDCSIALTTVPAALGHRPDARVLWLDAHGDFHTPETTESGYLGGMALAGACGAWDPRLRADPVVPARVVLAGVREIDDGERQTLERGLVTVIGASPIETLVAVKNALDGAPVFLHLDLDVLDPDDFPAQFTAPGGLRRDKLLDVLEAVSGDCEIVGVEITSFAPEDELERRAAASVAMHVLEPVLDTIRGEAHVRH